MYASIETNVPMPPHGRAIYPFELLGVGDSFAIREGDDRRAAAAASQWGKRHGRKLSIRKTANGWRCWRVA